MDSLTFYYKFTENFEFKNLDLLCFPDYINIKIRNSYWNLDDTG